MSTMKVSGSFCCEERSQSHAKFSNGQVMSALPAALKPWDRDERTSFLTIRFLIVTVKHRALILSQNCSTQEDRELGEEIYPCVT